MDRLLEWITQPSCEQRLEKVRRFWAGEGRFLVSVPDARCRYRPHHDGPDGLPQLVEALRHQSEQPGLNLPWIALDAGTISTARYWGGRVRNDAEVAEPYIEPAVRTLEEALALEPAAVDDPNLDAAQAVELYHRVCRALPTQSLWLRSPDFQGPLNTAGLVLDQEELFMAMAGEPQRLDQFLDGVTAFLIRYSQYLRRQTRDRICGNVWPLTFLPADMGVALTEDLMPLLSPQMYERFGIPQLVKLNQALGGLHIHCCGQWGRHAPLLARADLTIRAVEYHHPATTIEQLAPLADHTVFVPYLLADQQSQFANLVDYWQHLLDHTDSRHRFWFVSHDCIEPFLTFARRHAQACV